MDRLTDAVASMLDPAAAERSGRLRDALVAEDVALGDAVREIERTVTSSSTGPRLPQGPHSHSATKVDV
ncbi:hypothetical protein [Gordonia sp. SMJS1]|uniref:hypothetical protein n=1 Tax=Gordonia sp. SMJS1 TaxID=3039400 RepID=UPI002456F60E|nr:hypothetical protein [Gordonia sp. SMJS1]WGJ87240.1 hypothetical protein QAD21_09085 [Gordonia sp. SMJS1]